MRKNIMKKKKNLTPISPVKNKKINFYKINDEKKANLITPIKPNYNNSNL